MSQLFDPRIAEALERPHRLRMIGGELEDQIARSAAFSAALLPFYQEFCGDSSTTLSDSSFCVVDLGTGGGLPGVVLAAMHPSWQWVLADKREGRILEVQRSLAKLGLQAQAKAIAIDVAEAGVGEWREQFHLVVARSFGPSWLTAECAAPLLLHGGGLVVAEPPESDEDRWPKHHLAKLGLSEAVIRVVDGYRFAVMEKVDHTPLNVPRRPVKKSRGWY